MQATGRNSKLYKSRIYITDELQLNGDLLAFAISLTGRATKTGTVSYLLAHSEAIDIAIIDAKTYKKLRPTDLIRARINNQNLRIVIISDDDSSLPDPASVNADYIIKRSSTLEEALATLNRIEGSKIGLVARVKD